MNATIDRVEQDLIDLGRSLETRRSYLGALRRLQQWHGTPLEELGPEELQQYMRHLVRTKPGGHATHTMFVAAARFCYAHTLAQPTTALGLKRPRAKVKIPVVMTADEVRRCLAAATCHRDRAMIMCAYGAGLRISEVRHLRACDIDAESGVLRVHNGKGRKERVVMLAEPLLAELREAWREQRPEGPWVFPGMRPGMPICARQVRRIWEQVQKRAGLRRLYRFHCLRGTFATHLLDGGNSLQAVQVLLGHARMSSTIRYVAVQDQHVRNVASPLDTLRTA